MQHERFVITPWFGNDPTASARALVLPGGGYTVDHPVLFWSCQVLAQAGYRVVTMRWETDDQATVDPQAFVEEAADALDAGAGPATSTLVLAKSLGSYAAGWASWRTSRRRADTRHLQTVEERPASAPPFGTRPGWYPMAAR